MKIEVLHELAEECGTNLNLDAPDRKLVTICVTSETREFPNLGLTATAHWKTLSTAVHLMNEGLHDKWTFSEIVRR